MINSKHVVNDRLRQRNIYTIIYISKHVISKGRKRGYYKKVGQFSLWISLVMCLRVSVRMLILVYMY